ncbi:MULTISPECIES: M23 family metallopeptidase [Pandoraea]|uniref:M23 family metallopeptidase n=1 Tax=Pandoraea TaxID=93217 RepID=UPI002ADE8757|nr:M23 family metallopeptidase [Pandoraea norimbergensis]
MATVGSALTLGMVTAFGVAPMVPDSARNGASITLPLTFPDLARQIQQLDAQSQTFIHQVALRRGETLGDMLSRLSIQDPAAERFIRENAVARRLIGVPAGQVVQAETDDDGKLVTLSTLISSGTANAQQLVIERNDAGKLRARMEQLANDTEWSMRSGAIAGNFFTAMDDAGVPDAVVAQMVNIFSGVINFQRDVRRGDRFRLVYEVVKQQDRTVRTGRILAIEFINQGKTHQAIWYADPQGNTDGAYYGFDGRNLKQAFLRTPVEFSRISSAFGGREHPFQHQWKKHEGVDLAAPVGTRVFAAGDGVVKFVGKQNGYGNLIEINHAGDYQTRYAHLSGFSSGLKPGARVTQGQVIGFVGQTGWATGPHLHYELRYKNVPRNPFATDVAAVAPLSGPRLKLFDMYAANLLKRIDLMRTVQVAERD